MTRGFRSPVVAPVIVPSQPADLGLRTDRGALRGLQDVEAPGHRRDRAPPLQLPLRAAIPAWKVLAGVPNWPLMPDARLTAMLIARAMAAASRPMSRETPAAVPIAPQVDV